MSPEDVPTDLVEKAARARINAQWGRPAHRPIEDHEWAAVRSGIEEKWMAAALAAVLPDIQAQALRDVAENLSCDLGRLSQDDPGLTLAVRVLGIRAARLTATTEERFDVDGVAEEFGIDLTEGGTNGA